MRKSRSYKKISFFDLCLIAILIGVIITFIIYQRPDGPNIREEVVKRVFSKVNFGRNELTGSQTSNAATEINLVGISRDSSLNNDRKTEKKAVENVNKMKVKKKNGAWRRLSPFGNIVKGSPEEQLNNRLNMIPDTRPNNCKYDENINKFGDSVSIAVVFKGNEWLDAKMTILSVLKFTDINYIKEILLVDGGSNSQEIDYFLKICPKCISLKCNQEPFWQCRKTIEVKGKYLVFLSSQTTVTKGWLLPLVYTLDYSPESIVIPHINIIDNILLMNIKVSHHFFICLIKSNSFLNFFLINYVLNRKSIHHLTFT